jgi:D-sedoheptulose 7-phosphate isomerase
MTFSEEFLEQCASIIPLLDVNKIERVADILVGIRLRKGRLFIIGSGGGAGHASHAVCDFRKLCNIEAYAPYDNISELTARVNDEGWETSLLNWLLVSNLTNRDCIFVISVGGGSLEKNISMNIVNAIQYANEIGANIIGIVGKDGGVTNDLGDVILIPTVNIENVTPLTEGFQSVIWHLLVSHPKLKINQTKW